MATTRSRKLFVNLAVRDLDRSKEFFKTLGFEFDPKFTDENATCMLVGEDAYVMLLTEPFFRKFTRKEPCDTRAQTEALCAFSCESRAEVDDLVKKALAAGGSRPWSRRIKASCTAGASTTWMTTTGRSSGWTRRRSSGEGRGPNERNHAIPVVRRKSRGGSEVLHLGVQELEGRERGALRRGRSGPKGTVMTRRSSSPVSSSSL